MYTVSKTQEGHIPFLVEGMKKLLKMHVALDGYYKVPEDGFLEDMLKKDTISFVALKDGRPVGFARGRCVIDPPDKIESFVILNDMFVEEEHRGKGVGTLLLEAFGEKAKEEGAKKIELHVDVRNEIGLKAWEASGFEIHQYRMKKDIT
tara:strand:- start:2918 stop:3364 length:447 start_codon:yes stop_codon:yes gene_type:complete